MPDNSADPIPPEKPPRLYKFLIMALPVGVVIGTIVFMVMYFYMEREEERDHAVIASYGMRVSDLDDMVGKLTERIGERSIETEKGRTGLRRTASMIEGRLGPQNVGYPVKKGSGEAAHGRLWKSLWVDIRGEETPDQVVFAAASYAGAGEVADANTVSTLTMLAVSMAREKTARTLRFVFLPMNQSPVEQNKWILKHCLGAGESCAGIIGIHTMETNPETGSENWQATTSMPSDKAWWQHLSQGARAGAFTGERIPSVWITHPVFSPHTWVGQQETRLMHTLGQAREIRGWLLRASGSPRL